MKLNWLAGAKSSIAFGLGGILTIGVFKLFPEFVILLLFAPGIMIGLLFAVLNKQDLKEKGFLIRSPLLFSTGSIGAGALVGVALIALEFLFEGAKSIEVHFAWISGLVFSLVLGLLISYGHSYSHKKESVFIMAAVGASLASVNGLYLEEIFRQNNVELPSLIWLMGFGFAVGLGLQRKKRISL